MSWIQTYIGKRLNPFKPDKTQINIVDIAHALSLICRYNGHTKKFYSVSEHSLLVSKHCPDEYKLHGLLHDAAEAYLADIPRPIKATFHEYREVEHSLLGVIFDKFGVSYPLPEAVKRIDDAILADEGPQLMGSTEDWVLPEAPLGITIECLTPSEAELAFLREFSILMEGTDE